MDLSGRAALITGAARGIGFAIADRLSREGARVALLDVDAPRLTAAARSLSDQGRRVLAVTADVTARHEIETAVARALNAFGHMDILVNNAGIAGQWMPLWELPDEIWHRVHAVNLTGAFYVTRALIGPMRERPTAGSSTSRPWRERKATPTRSPIPSARPG